MWYSYEWGGVEWGEEHNPIYTKFTWHVFSSEQKKSYLVSKCMKNRDTKQYTRLLLFLHADKNVIICFGHAHTSVLNPLLDFNFHCIVLVVFALELIILHFCLFSWPYIWPCSAGVLMCLSLYCQYIHSPHHHSIIIKIPVMVKAGLAN